MKSFRQYLTRITLIVFMLGLIAGHVTVIDAAKDGRAGEPSNLYARAAVLMDAESGRILFEKDGFQEMPMASTTKIMTCIVALESGKLDDIVTVSSRASKAPDVQLNIREGEQYRLENLLYSLMLESHNDVAIAVAEHVGGSVEGFAEMMNRKAKELGAHHTSFVTPNGLDADEHYTTAADLAKIAAYAIKNKDFVKITNTSSYTLKENNKKRSFSLQNANRFLNMVGGAMGIKTGFTNGAGYCFVGAVRDDGKTLISVVLGSGWPPNKNWKWADTRALMKYGLDNYQMKTVVDANFAPGKIVTKDGIQKELSCRVKIDDSTKLLVSPSEKIETKVVVPDVIQAPVVQGEKVGSLQVYVGGELYKEYELTADHAVEKIDFFYCIDKVMDMMLSR